MIFQQLIPVITGSQTLGEEYTDIWQFSPTGERLPPSTRRRAYFILLPTLAGYGLGRLRDSALLRQRAPRLVKSLGSIPTLLEIIAELNLAIFYLRGTYHDLIQRVFRIQYVCAFVYTSSNCSRTHT